MFNCFNAEMEREMLNIYLLFTHYLFIIVDLFMCFYVYLFPNHDFDLNNKYKKNS